MASATRCSALVVTLLLAGCGGGAQQQEHTRAAPVENAQVAAAIEDCGVSPAVAADGAVVPEEVRPDPAQVAAASTTDGGYEARVIYARPLREAMNAIVKAAKATGHEIAFTEYEGSDGEIELERGGGRTVLRLLAVRNCPSVSQATITAAPE